jgi:predicted transcriptional regulator
MSLRKDVMKEIAAFLRETGMTPTEFSEQVGDRTLMTSLRAGRDPKASMIDRIRAYIAKERAKRSPSLDAASAAAA